MLHINTTEQKITITANTATGAFNGAQTLISLIEGNNGDLIEMSITDKPRYANLTILIVLYKQPATSAKSFKKYV